MQGLHASKDSAPTAELKVPTGHGSHGAFATVLKLPVGQGM